MKILLTNDDGIQSPGLGALEDRLSSDHEIWVLAPDNERSGSSHAITLKGAVRMRNLSPRHISCNGTPADCVLYGLLGVLPERPDIVLSGINIGHNLGTDIVYSGTAGAAREASFSNIPGIAVSIESGTSAGMLRAAADFIGRNLEILAGLWTPEHFININFPDNIEESGKVAITHPSRRIYKDKVKSFTAPNSDMYYYMDGTPPENGVETDSDWYALSRGFISVSPVYLHPVNHRDDEAYKMTVFM